MLLRKALLAVSIVFVFCVNAQEVPRRMSFADIELKIEDDAAVIIKERMNKLTANQKFFNNLKAKFDLHAPIIQRILTENKVPDEFKYLCVMESSLNPAAVSTSNAVGYWQFKKESGVEVGLRVDAQIDERKNIVASTIAACKYLKRSNSVLNNWVLTCQSYNQGLGGTKRSVDNALFGVKKMTIDGKTHEYVVKFLAYILLFNANASAQAPSLILMEYDKCADKTLAEIADIAEIKIEDLKPHNLWLNTNKVPTDKQYIVLLPVQADKTGYVVEKLKITTFSPEIYANKTKADSVGNTTTTTDSDSPKPKKKWWRVFGNKDSDQLNSTDVPVYMNINGIPAIQAKPGDNSHKLANQGGIRYKRFLKNNEMRSFDDLIPGKFYYLDKKKSQAAVVFHIVMPNESLWEIAQKYGVTSESIMEKNRMADGEALALGRKLYLRHHRPANEAVIIEKVKLPEPIRDTIYQTNTEVIRDTVIRIDTVIKKVVIKEKTPSKIDTNPKVLEQPKIEDLDNETENPVKTSVLPNPVNMATHVVEQGQTMYFISKKYNVPVDSIKKWNNLLDNNLKIGSTLIIGNTTTKSEATKTIPASATTLSHEVKHGETLYAIARKYGVSVTELSKLNQLENNAIKPGMTLIIRK
jgi:membrane-bound lytic murein transglycosylase D